MRYMLRRMFASAVHSVCANFYASMPQIPRTLIKSFRSSHLALLGSQIDLAWFVLSEQNVMPAGCFCSAFIGFKIAVLSICSIFPAMSGNLGGPESGMLLPVIVESMYNTPCFEI